MKRQAQKLDTDELQDLLVQEWYNVSRIMHMFIPITFPCLTFMGFVQAAKFESEEKKDGTIGGKSMTIG